MLPLLPPSDVVLLDERASFERESLSERRSRSRLSLSFLSFFDFLPPLELLVGRSTAFEVVLGVVAATASAALGLLPAPAVELLLVVPAWPCELLVPLLLLVFGLPPFSSDDVVVVVVVLMAGLCDGFGLRPCAMLDAELAATVGGNFEPDADVDEDAADLDDLSRSLRSRSFSLSLCEDFSLRFSSRRCCSSYFLSAPPPPPDVEDDDDDDAPMGVGVAPADDCDFSLFGLLLLCLLLLPLLLFSFLSRSDLSVRCALLPPLLLPLPALLLAVRSVFGADDDDDDDE